MKFLLTLSSLVLFSVTANASGWECVAVDRGFEEHRGGHVGNGHDRRSAKRDALRQCRNRHGECEISRCESDGDDNRSAQLSGRYDFQWSRWNATLRLEQNGDRLEGSLFGNGHARRECYGSVWGRDFDLTCSFWNTDRDMYWSDYYTGTISGRGRRVQINGTFTNDDHGRPARWSAQKIGR